MSKNNRDEIANRETTFNSSLASLERLSDSFSRCNYYYQMATAQGYDPDYLFMLRKEIISAYKEIYPKLSKEIGNLVQPQHYGGVSQ